MADNSMMMRCSQCGEMNQLPRVHCMKCGAKLDFDAAEQHMIEVNDVTLQDKLSQAGKLALIGLFILIIALLIWPGKMTRTSGEAIDAKRYRLKSELLVDALNRGMPASQVIKETEINAYLNELVEAQAAAKKGRSGSLEDIGARFFTDRAEVFIAVGRGPFTLTAHFYAKPQGDDLVITSAKAGHLPLPGILGRIYAKTQSGLFRQLKNESRIVRNLDGAVVNDGSIEVLVKARD